MSNNADRERPLPLTPELAYEAFRPLTASVGVELAARSHPGGRAVNEDHYLIVRLGRFQETLATSLPDGSVPPRFEESGYGLVVADGLGFAGVGEAASRLAISTLAHLMLHYGQWNLRITPQVAEDVMSRGWRFYRLIDEQVTEAAMAHPELSGMGSTLTAAYTAGDALFIAHVGHSRAYIFRQDLLTQLTRDQTLRQRLTDTTRPTPIELAAHDVRHVLTDAIGGRAGCADIAIGQYRLKDGDVLLLCTNGLSDVVNDDNIAAVLRQPLGLEERCRMLVDLAVSRCGIDNVTAVMAKFAVPAVEGAGTPAGGTTA